MPTEENRKGASIREQERMEQERLEQVMEQARRLAQVRQMQQVRREKLNPFPVRLHDPAQVKASA